MTMGALSQVATAVDGRLNGPDREYDSVSTDTRKLAPGQLFVALRGERFDASTFVAEAASRGAAGAVVEQIADVDLSQIEVPDSRLALGAMAREWRQQFELPLIGITGSNGKTTVKELTAAIMRAVCPGEEEVLATQGNLNNDIGLPLTLLGLRAQHCAAVIEMGANHPGEIAVLADIAMPNVAIISNAARAHLEGFGSLEDVARTKGELLDVLRAGETAVLNRDDRFFADWSERASAAHVVSFGLTAEADYHAVDVVQEMQSGRPVYRFVLVSPEAKYEVVLPMVGQHNILNALAAAAAATAAGATPAQVCAGLQNSRNVPGRLRAFQAAGGAMIYDDSYNANPDSVMAAIAFLSQQPGDTLLVLGDMGELGPDAAELHRRVGERARTAGIGKLLCVGDLSRETAKGFGESAEWYADVDALEEVLQDKLQVGRNVLFKASRFMGLDRLVARIEQDAAESGVRG